MIVIKILKKPSKTRKKSLRKGLKRNTVPSVVFGWGGFDYLLWGEDFFSVLEGFFEFLITSTEF